MYVRPINLEKISSRLLEYLRTELKNPDLNYQTAPTQIGQGFETFSYKFQLENAPNNLSKPLKLRLFPETIEKIAYKEGTTQNLLLEYNFPVARAHILCENKKHLGGEFIVSDFLPGKTLAETLPFEEEPEALADIHVILHQIDSSKIVKALKLSTVSPEWYDGTIWSDTRGENIQWLKPAVTWIKENTPEIDRSVLCHGDFHSNNVLIESGRVSGVLDWSAAHIGEPERDVTSTMTVMMAYGPLFSPEQESKWFVENYLEAYKRRMKVDQDKLEYYEAVNCIGYLDAMETGGSQETPYEVRKRLLDRFKEISDISLIKKFQ